MRERLRGLTDELIDVTEPAEALTFAYTVAVGAGDGESSFVLVPSSRVQAPGVTLVRRYIEPFCLLSPTSALP
jgi:hypothetical protein